MNLIKLLLEKGASINSKDMDGQTPLYYAVVKEPTVYVEFLLEYGADYHVINSSGFSAFLWAVVAGH